jgi:hypothetical protein
MKFRQCGLKLLGQLRERIQDPFVQCKLTRAAVIHSNRRTNLGPVRAIRAAVERMRIMEMEGGGDFDTPAAAE